MNPVLLRNTHSEHERGNLAEAARLYGEALRDNPNDPGALCMLGLVYMQRGEVLKANTAADSAIRNATNSAPASYTLGCLP